MSESQSKNIGELIINLFVFLIKFMLQPFAVIWYMFTFQAEEFCRGIYKIFAYMLIMVLCVFEIAWQIGTLFLGFLKTAHE